MTCIVGLVHEGSVFIGGDSAGVNERLDVFVRADEKVFTKGSMVLGFSGSFRMGQLLRYSFNPPDQTIGEDDFAYLCGPWVGSLSECMKVNGCATIKDNEIGFNGDFLLGFNGALYRIHEDFQVAKRTEPYNSCGCASDYAIGAMSMLIDTDLEPEEKIIMALEVAERFSAGVKGPFVIKQLSENEIDFTFTEELDENQRNTERNP